MSYNKITLIERSIKMSTETTSKNFDLERVIVLWIYPSKDGKKTYLSGKTEDNVLRLTGFFNKEKQNPKEPDIRLYTVSEKNERSDQVYLSLWVNATKNGKKVISGKLNNKKVVGFFNPKATVGGVLPYINIYWSDEQKAEVKTEGEAVQAEFEEIPSDMVLPF